MDSVKGKIVVISGPSGAGKNTVFDGLVKKSENITQTISVTTRAPRTGERNGVDYYFVTIEEFERKIEQGEFLEYVKYGKNYYGTLKSEVKSLVSRNKTVVLIIEVNGAMHVKKEFPEALSIFIYPPSVEVLRSRICGRGDNNSADTETRLKIAEKEMEMSDQYDYKVINDDLDKCIDEIYEIIKQ